MFNLLPDISSEEKIKAFLTKNNDTTFVIYVCSIIRSIVSLHGLINNREMNKEAKIKFAKKNLERKNKKIEDDKKKVEDAKKEEKK